MRKIHLGSCGEAINTYSCSVMRLTKKFACNVYATDAANLNPEVLGVTGWIALFLFL
jgi:hypothetical protein